MIGNGMGDGEFLVNGCDGMGKEAGINKCSGYTAGTFAWIAHILSNIHHTRQATHSQASHSQAQFCQDSAGG